MLGGVFRTVPVRRSASQDRCCRQKYRADGFKTKNDGAVWRFGTAGRRRQKFEICPFLEWGLGNIRRTALLFERKNLEVEIDHAKYEREKAAEETAVLEL